MKERCPICNHTLTESTDHMDHVIMEVHITCDNCKKYHFDYVTGGYRIVIDDKYFEWSYLDNEPDKCVIEQAITKATMTHSLGS